MYFTTRWRLVGGPKGCWTILLVKVLHYASRVKLTQGFLLKVQSDISGLKATSLVSIMFGCNKQRNLSSLGIRLCLHLFIPWRRSAWQTLQEWIIIQRNISEGWLPADDPASVSKAPWEVRQAAMPSRQPSCATCYRRLCKQSPLVLAGETVGLQSMYRQQAAV